MKLLLILVLSIILAFLVYFIYLGIKSQQGEAQGLINHKLTPCPNKPNCINSEFEDATAHYYAPIPYTTEDKEKLVSYIINTIQQSGGVIKTQQANYIAATYTSKLFRYVDDLEIRIDDTNQLIHIRSASRVGHSDFGVNRERAEKFRELLLETRSSE